MRLVFALLLLSYLQPNHFPPWVSWHSEGLVYFCVMSMTILAAWPISRQTGWAQIEIPTLAFPLGALCLISWIQFAFGQLVFAGDAFVLTFYIALCVICLVKGRASCDDKHFFIQLAITLTIAAAFSAVIALVQAFDLYENASWINRMHQLRRPGGNLGQPNQLATLLLMGLASLVYIYQSKRSGGFVTALLAALLFLGMASTESRTGVLSFAVLTLGWFFLRKKSAFTLKTWTTVVFGVAFLFLFWLWPSLMDSLLLTEGEAGKVNLSAGARWQVWPQLLDAALKKPWLGWGLGQVPMAHNAVAHEYASISNGAEPFTYAHNLVLDLALGVGVPITALALLAAAIWLWRRLCAIQNQTSFYCLAIVVPVAVHSMLEFPFAYAYFLAPVMFALGALDGLSCHGKGFQLDPKKAASAVFVVGCLMLWSVYEYVEVEEDFRIVRFESLLLGKTPENYSRPKVILLTQLDALLRGGRIVPKMDMSLEQLQLSREVALRYPWTATQNRYALSLALNGNPQEAIRQLKVMHTLHGEKTFKQIKEYWKSLADEKYPQLKNFPLP